MGVGDRGGADKDVVILPERFEKVYNKWVKWLENMKV